VQLVKNGPDIPERLLQAHEEGRAVLFCGAGVSYPAGLPGFSGLVKKLYSELGVSPSALEAAAIKNSQFDTAIGLIEGRIVGGRATVREGVAEARPYAFSGHRYSRSLADIIAHPGRPLLPHHNQLRPTFPGDHP
jgi:hypothetical protein